ncbi:MAG TPA: c-type cytochrome [Terriglobia bacterium]|nr:c-type cytochrome [Terriglobia bacterium]
MTSGRITTASMLGLILALLAAANAPAAKKQMPDAVRLAAALNKAPAAARTAPNPYTGQSDAVLAGRKLFRQHCAQCHGEEAQGRGKAPSLHSAALQQTPPGVLFWFLRNGNLRKGMPSWSGLPEQERWQLVSYLETLP